MQPSKESRAPGRPRDPQVEERILATTIAHLAQSGYSRMSLDEIAAASGVSKPTIYRRWSGKADLATAAIRSIQLAEPGTDSGSTIDDLIGILTNFRRNLLRPNGISLVGTVLAEEHHTPELLALFRERLVKPRRQMLRAILKRARKRDELRADADLECAVHMLAGAFYAHYLADGSIPEDYPARIVRIVWSGISK